MDVREVSTVVLEVNDDPNLRQIARDDALQPGRYWRAKRDIINPARPTDVLIKKGRSHLLMSVFQFDGQDHTVTLLSHPLQTSGGSGYEIQVLLPEFLEAMEPEHNIEAVRRAEREAIMADSAKLQEKLSLAYAAPHEIDELNQSIQSALDTAQRVEEAAVMREEGQRKEKENRLHKIHRRAARRSANAGNPLVPKKATISDSVGVMIAEGITSDGLADLISEAKRREIIAEATSKWVAKVGEEISRTMKSLTPFFAEQGHLAKALAHGAMSKAKEIEAGLRSLKLYTGDGTDVITLCEGKDAPSVEPLTLIQSPRYMEEELAVFGEVSTQFNHEGAKEFFEQLVSNKLLRDQVLPTPRCVAGIAATRYARDYSHLSVLEAAKKAIADRSVALLVRNGENIHVVYSGEPSHEMTPHLFPTKDEMEAPFRGYDNTKIGINDLAFSQSAKRAEQISLHYRRFHILLCGLDHRLKLFGDFYPREKAMEFLGLEFQSLYFRFLVDDDAEMLIGDGLQPVLQWIRDVNEQARSGSRIITTATGLAAHSPQVVRVYDLQVNEKMLPGTLVAFKEGNGLKVKFPVINQRSGLTGQATAVLRDDGGKLTSGWFLCLDAVRLGPIERYLASRISREMGIFWLRTFRRAREVLLDEAQSQSALRAYLIDAVRQSGVMEESQAQEAMEAAISHWRAANRGADAPRVEETAKVNEILTLMFPAQRIVDSSQENLQKFIDENRFEPLKMVRISKGRFALYVKASEEDKQPYGGGLHWGWVKRVVLQFQKTKVAAQSQSLVWLMKDKADPAEVVVQEWPALAQCLNTEDEPVKLKDVRSYVERIQEVAAWAGPLLRGEIDPDQVQKDPRFVEVFSDIKNDVDEVYSASKYYTPMSLFLPVAIRHEELGAKPCFIGVTCSLSAFAEKYMTPADAAWISRRQSRNNEVNRDFVWRFEETVVPVEGLVKASSNRPASFATIQARKKGGVKRKWLSFDAHTRDIGSPKKRGENGPFRARKEAVPLSLKRAFQGLLGDAPHLRKVFREIAKEKARRGDFPWVSWDGVGEPEAGESKEQADARLRKQKNAIKYAKYQRPDRKLALSPLLMENGITVIHKHFSGKYAPAKGALNGQ